MSRAMMLFKLNKNPAPGLVNIRYTAQDVNIQGPSLQILIVS